MLNVGDVLALWQFETMWRATIDIQDDAVKFHFVVLQVISIDLECLVHFPTGTIVRTCGVCVVAS